MDRISVFGLGYVGCVSAACLARDGHTVVGVDVSSAKVDRVNAGHSTIVEDGIDALVADGVRTGRLHATLDLTTAILSTEISLICVGTPSRRNGNIDLSHVLRVCEQIGAELATKPGWHAIVIRSTVLPGTIDEVLIPLLERHSGKRAGIDFGVASNPEFLREGTSIKDYDDPPFTIVGASDAGTADRIAALYSAGAPVHRVPIRVAEALKYACNAFHALKVGFANEFGSICKSLAIDSHDVMRLFSSDTKLNISAKYLRPGFAFGGSCLPKDVRALMYRAREHDIETPILNGLLASNQRQIDRAFQMILQRGTRDVAVLGLAFKAGTDDLRESPMVTLVEMLLGRGCRLRIYDRAIQEANITGANREYVAREIPHLWSLMATDLTTALAGADIVVIGNDSPEFADLPTRVKAQTHVIDLARSNLAEWRSHERYEGFCW